MLQESLHAGAAAHSLAGPRPPRPYAPCLAHSALAVLTRGVTPLLSAPNKEGS